jgi:hypothetical protein
MGLKDEGAYQGRCALQHVFTSSAGGHKFDMLSASFVSSLLLSSKRWVSLCVYILEIGGSKQKQPAS